MRVIIFVDGKHLMLAPECNINAVTEALKLDRAQMVFRQDRYRENSKWEVLDDAQSPLIQIVPNDAIKKVQTKEEREQEKLKDVLEENKELSKDLRELRERVKKYEGNADGK